MSRAHQELSADSLFGVKGKVALVTGGGSGIGTMIATTLVANGARVWISSRKEGELRKVADELNEMGPGTCHYLAADLSTKSGCDKLGSHLASKEERLHILVNNSGATWGAPYDDFPEDNGWDKVMNVNVKATFYLTVALTPLLTNGSNNRDPSRVINTSSVASIDPQAEMAGVAEGVGTWSYGVSKAAVNHLTSIQAVYLGTKHVTVNAILPGLFKSKMTNAAIEVYGEELRQAQPTGRIGETSDVGGVVLFLCSKAGSHVTGAHIQLDGGANLARAGGFGGVGGDKSAKL